MLSQRQAVALRRVIVEAFASPGPSEPTITEQLIVAAESDLPARAPVGITIQRLGFLPTSLDGERQHHPNAGNTALVRSTRVPGELSITIVIRSRASSSAPHVHQLADYLARRLLTYLASDEAAWSLEQVGCPVLRTGAVRPLTSLVRGSQWASAAGIDLVLGLAALDVREVDWIASASGEGTVRDGAGGETVIPWDTRST